MGRTTAPLRGFEVAQLDRENCCLQTIEAAVETGDRVKVMRSFLPAVIRESTNRLAQRPVVRGNGAPVAERAEVLAGIEAECRRPPEAPGARFAPTCSVG